MSFALNSFYVSSPSQIPNGYFRLGETTTTSAAASFSLTLPVTRRRLFLVLATAGKAGLDSAAIRFNSDSGNNYSHRINSNGIADGTQTSQSKILLETTSHTGVTIGYYWIDNQSGRYKRIIGHASEGGAAVAASDRSELHGVWANTNQISTITILTALGQDLLTGAYLGVYGCD
jgi:hypothetical protein